MLIFLIVGSEALVMGSLHHLPYTAGYATVLQTLTIYFSQSSCVNKKLKITNPNKTTKPYSIFFSSVHSSRLLTPVILNNIQNTTW